MGHATADGRVLRRERSRTAVVDAILDLLVEGHPRPTAQQVSERSGVSMRTIFRLFDDMASLNQVAIGRQAERVMALVVPLTDTGPLADRIDALVTSRATVYEAITPVRRAAVRLSATSPEIARGLGQAAELFRAQVASTLGPELADRGPAVLEAVDLVTSWEAWERLRTTQGLAVPEAVQVVTGMLFALFAPGS
jgi:TetR/AcrR family transcriptional regulator, regulator of autoinduction and epiphytic fitness